MSILELDWQDPSALLDAFAPEPHIAILESSGHQTPRSRWTFLCVQPREVFTSSSHTCWSEIRRLTRPPRADCSDMVPFSGGVVGVASYEAGLALAGLKSRFEPVVPHMTALAFDGVFAFDRQAQRLFWTSDQGASPPTPRGAARPGRGSTLPIAFLRPDQSERDWKHAVSRIRAHIAQGDVFQANMTARWRGTAQEPIDVHALYGRLKSTSPAPFGGLFKTPAFSLLSASIERFISLVRDGWLETRPIKGTTNVGRSAAETAQLAAMLAHDEKEFGENLMITDLMRNDISRVCEVGSVTVSELCMVEAFAHVQHLISTIRGRLATGQSAFDLLQATLPPGSVTGAPKHAALKLIDRLEASARNTYCGTMFWIGNNGAMDSNVIIRSILVKDRDIEVGAGGGITHPSDPEKEYAEMRLKAEPLLRLFRA